MNANQIHVGEEYAIAPYGKPNGNVFVPNAIRIKAMRTFGEQQYGNRKLTMYVEGFRLDPNTGDITSTTYTKYRVRDVIEEWEDYEDQRDQHQVEEEKRRREQEERDRKWRVEQAERDRIRRSEQAEKERRVQRLKQRLAEVGLPGAQVDTYSNVVRINLIDLEQWLAGLQKVDCMTCGKQLLQIPSLRGL